MVRQRDNNKFVRRNNGFNHYTGSPKEQEMDLSEHQQKFINELSKATNKEDCLETESYQLVTFSPKNDHLN